MKKFEQINVDSKIKILDTALGQKVAGCSNDIPRKGVLDENPKPMVIKRIKRSIVNEEAKLDIEKVKKKTKRL